MMNKRRVEADVVIIGGGITGAAIARELSRYEVETILVEKGGELSAGQTKATLGNIYTGLNMVGSMILKSVLLPSGTPLNALYNPNKLMTMWNEQGFKEWPQVLEELDVRHRFMPLLILAKDKDQIEDLHRIRDLGRSIGGVYADFRQVDRDEIFALEPNVKVDVVTGLHAKDQIIDIFPPEIVIALAENAAQNGVKIMLNAEVTGISKEGTYQIVETAKGPIKTDFIINAAGGWGDRIADMGGGRDWGLQYNKTQLIILDKRVDGLINSMVRWPNKPGLLQLLQPRDKNILIECGTYDATDSPEDTGTILENVHKAISMAKTLVPAVSEKDIISTFTGVRVFNTRNVQDHIVEFSPTNPGFLNAMIRLPGIIGAPPMARHCVTMLVDAGLKLLRKNDFNPYLKAIPRFRELDDFERDSLITHDSNFGRVVCRCETVTKAEIIKAVKRGATTLDGVKFRTRTGMGRCQGNFCSPKITGILAKELSQPSAKEMPKVPKMPKIFDKISDRLRSI
jgi:glycerol-3-phosphate dehydrogenase